ncbi:MAG: phospholipase D-like domain-containing protein [Candidatus Alcyoniella australis]|nr:phospholipase D-like domain-containing protein [Candidatus Alcyoniella australis]
MTVFAQGKIEAFAGPQQLGAPDDLEDVIVRFIEGAKHTLDMAVQEIDSQVIAQAIIDARWRGVNIRLFLEQDYLESDKLPSATPKGDESPAQAKQRAQWTEYRRPSDIKTNRDILAALLRNNIDVKADFNPEIFHQKFIVRDYRGSKKATSAVLTGSTNFTVTGTHKNLNHIVIFHDYRICKDYHNEFFEILDGTFGQLSVRHESEFKTYNLGGVPVRILFSPDHSPELEIIKQMLKCKKRLDFAIFTFSGSSGIDDAMVMLRAAKKQIAGALDPGQGKQWWAATKWLHQEGIKVYFPNKVSGFGKLHHKLMVIDDDIVIGGSMNYTGPANSYNDENIFVLGNPFDLPATKGGPVDHAECKKLATFFRKEIKRIISNSTIYKLP